MLEFSFFINEPITLTLCLVEMKEIRNKRKKGGKEKYNVKKWFGCRKSRRKKRKKNI